MPLEAGEILRERYRIKEFISRGGMGSIYLAEDLRLEGRLCAVKEVRLDPSLGTTLLHIQLLGMAYFFGGRFETAAALFRERILLMPDTDWSRAYLASALGHLGRVDEARQVWADLMAINPTYVLADRVRRHAAQPRQIELVLDGARKAGLPF